ncbi:phage tail spike protein [Rothia sp. 32237D007AR]
MITVHPPESTTFTASGYGLLDNNIMDAVITEAINATYQLTFTYPADAPHAEHLITGNLVAATGPTTSTRQAFRITTVETSLAGLLRITALHISFDLAKVLIADTNITNRTPYQALAQIRSNATPTNSFTFVTNLSHIRSVRIVRQSVLECLLDTSKDNTFASRYGGEFFRNNLYLNHQQQLGADRGLTIRDQKNLTGYRATVDTSTMLTRVLPVGFDGLLLPEKYVDSPRLANYPAPLVGVMRFEHIKAAKEGETPKEDELPLAQAQEALRQAVRDAYTAGLDLPLASYEINFIDLATTEEYAGVAKLERVILGDTVSVIHTDFKANLKARVTGYSYDPVAKTYISLSLGSVSPTLSASTRTVSRALENLSEETAAAHETALAAQASADGKNTIHYGSTQPSAAQLGDTWFKQNGDKTEIWIYTLGTNNQPTWKSLASDINSSQIHADLDELEAALATVRSNIATVDALAKATDAALKTTNTQVAAARAKADETATAHDALRLEFTNNQHTNEQALIAIRNDVLLRATKGELIAQINVSPETILIDGKRIHITGTTSIDNAVIKTAMIADAAVTNAKIQSLDAAKITTGYLAAARILAGSIPATNSPSPMATSRPQ